MSRKAPTAATGPESSEQRRLPRKAALLSGVLADLNGGETLDCAIQDINARGAAVGVSRKLPFGGQVYLLDTGNRFAHLARVVWCKGDRAGLMFVQSYAMGPGLPPRMRFLWRLLLEAKLRQADRAVAMGISAELALGTVGLTREHVHQMARYATADRRFQSLLHRVERLLEDEE
jgi:PilZ domain-containing protein